MEIFGKPKAPKGTAPAGAAQQEVHPQAEESKWPSLEVVRDELNHEISAQGERLRSLDGRAGVQLGFSGVLVGLVKAVDHPHAVQLAGQAAAALAGVLAVTAFLSRRGEAILDPRGLRMRYLLTPAEDTRLVVLDTRIALFTESRKNFKDKVKLLAASLIFLSAALVLLVLGTSLAVGKGDQNDGTGKIDKRAAATTPALTRSEPRWQCGGPREEAAGRSRGCRSGEEVGRAEREGGTHVWGASLDLGAREDNASQ